MLKNQANIDDMQGYFFDLKKSPDILHNGELWRLLSAEGIEKVYIFFCATILKN